MGKKGKSGPRGEAAKTPPAGQTGGGSGPPGIGAKESGSKAGSTAGGAAWAGPRPWWRGGVGLVPAPECLEHGRGRVSAPEARGVSAV